jgi:phosphoglycolate phosphatase-like HAD superfamily hydrolase
VRQTLQELYNRGVRMVVATNKPSDYSRNILTPGRGFLFMECSGPDRRPPKPDPMLNGLMIALQVRPIETLMWRHALDVETARMPECASLIATGGNSLPNWKPSNGFSLPRYHRPHLPFE